MVAPIAVFCMAINRNVTDFAKIWGLWTGPSQVLKVGCLLDYIALVILFQDKIQRSVLRAQNQNHACQLEGE